MTAGTADKVALYWYAEPFVLTHRSWCGDYTHTHACRRATLTRTHALTNTRTYAPMHATLKCTLAHTQHSHACMHIAHYARHTLNLYVHAPFVKDMDCYGY